MLIGMFMEEMRQGVDQAAWFREAFDLIDTAEAGGLDGVWLGEIHFLPTRSALSASLVMAASIVARTRRLRVGTAVHLIPLNNPLRIAEEAATIDQISGGRLDFGVGRSGSPRAYDAYGIPYGESQARFREALEVIRLAWGGGPISYKGEFFRFDDVVVSPSPVQKPHPPIRMAATSDETYPLVGQLGLHMFVGLRNLDVPELSQHIRRYREARREAGHAGPGEVFLRIPVYAGETARGAREEPHDTIRYYFKRQADVIRTPAGRGDTGSAERRNAQADRLLAMTYDEMLRTKVAFGTAPELVDRFRALGDELGLTGIVAEINPGGLLPAELEKRTLAILTRDVLPSFR